VLILDEDKARKFAHQFGLAYTGTLGVIIKAKNRGIVSAVIPLIEKLKSVNFRLSENVEKEILKQAGE
jgi:predicted nucleic acid-binding protein